MSRYGFFNRTENKRRYVVVFSKNLKAGCGALFLSRIAAPLFIVKLLLTLSVRHVFPEKVPFTISRLFNKRQQKEGKSFSFLRLKAGFL